MKTRYLFSGLTQKGYNNITTSLGSAGAKKYQYKLGFMYLCSFDVNLVAQVSHTRSLRTRLALGGGEK
ncbi:hypothetical protein LA303_08935 [Candidatus Sulfidibacterium hydrothermale]|uniref:hypothetical protein n=1 Tax=Candidatus Sulfidibacterium hydrothermale TaxID=2875962 RepID=UPI001F0B31AD|nr:hypothetical protein [Candidatus Sulfidibacterium hydrothermale]UBM61540.1 hypothetical protein LA303_08935 [Candidatus Sulfidibacterium hydrothermale]